MKPKIGMICRYDNSGLGSLSWEFSRHLKPDKVLLVQNGYYQTFPERYADWGENEIKIIPSSGTITSEDLDWFMRDLDIVFSFETFYDWSIVKRARRHGIRTVLYTMYEMTQEFMPIHPTHYICPSELDMKYFPEGTLLSPPIATDRIIWKERKIAKHFVHSGSHAGVNGRKGTQLLLDAISLVKTKDIKFTIYSWQGDFNVPDDPRIEIKIVNFKNYWQMWREGDVLIYPQDYNGICLPIVEAMSAGLGVITTNIYPFNGYMPGRLMFEPDEMYMTRAAKGLKETEAARISPKVIAAKIDEVANTDITKESRYGKDWAEKHSWDIMLPKYQEYFNNLCQIK